MSRYWIVLLVGLALGAAPAWWLTADHYQGVIAKEHEAQQNLVIEQQEENLKGFIAYANRLVNAEVNREKNDIVVRNLRNELGRVRVEFPVCPMPGTTEAKEGGDEAARLLSARVDELFERLQKRAGGLVEEADELNLDAIRHNEQVGD